MLLWQVARLLLEMYGDWKHYLAQSVTEEGVKSLRRHEATGRLLGNEFSSLVLRKRWDERCACAKGPKGPWEGPWRG